MIYDITREIRTGMWIAYYFIPYAFIIFLCAMTVELLYKVVTKKKIQITMFKWICQYLWILLILAILKITGIWGGNFGLSTPFDSYISFHLFEDGVNAATILNIVLFIPFGFLPVFIFKNIEKHWWNGILIGAVFSIVIEFLQTFVGRFAQLDDVITNTFGALVGFLIGRWIVRIYQRKLEKK